MTETPPEAPPPHAQDVAEETTATPLLVPQDGVPDLVDTPEALARVVEAFAAATGPVAADAERATTVSPP